MPATRVIFVNRFFYPDNSATSLMLGDLAFALGDLEAERHVITSRSHYAGKAGMLSKRELIDGVSIHRVASLNIGNRSLLGRALNFLSFYVFGFARALRLAREGDVLVCLTDPPLASVPIGLAARLKGARLINWLQDIYPETASRLGYGRSDSFLARVVKAMRDWSWRNARVNVAIGRRMADQLASRGIERSRIQVIANWADEQALTPLTREENPMRRAWNFAPGDCVVGYSGNLGRAHDISTMLGAIERCTDTTLKFLFIGGGAKLNELRRLTQRRAGLRLHFRGYQPRDKLRQSLSVPDIHWLSLNPMLEGLIVPSKFYGAAAVGRPIVFVGDTHGEIARLIDEAECGRSFAPGQSEELAAYLRELSAEPDRRRALGCNARLFSENELSRADRLAEWSLLLNEQLVGS